MSRPPAPSSTTIGALLHELAGRWPHHPAVIHHGARISFAELDRRVDDWARALLACGVKAGDGVGVLIGNRPEWLIATSAAARIGALVTPLNTWYKESELSYALEHSGTVLLITAAGQRKQDFTQLVSAVCPRLSGDPATSEDQALPTLKRVIGIDPSMPAGATSLQDFLAAGRAVTDDELHAAEARVSGEDALYVLYTSGSTARPKGVLLQHGATIVNNFNIGERQGLSPEDIAWLAIPLFYGFAAVNAIVAVWSHGGALLLQEYFDPDEALDLIERERATVYYGLGNMTRSLLAANASKPRDISSLQKGLTGYSYEDKRLVIEDLGVTGCCSIYGLTESHGLAAMTDSRDPVELRLGSDGRLLPGWDLRIVDPETEKVLPDGSTGHLLIRGYLTRGYLGDPEMTAAAFTEEGYFRTGDLVRVDPQGLIHFHSRLKGVIKTGGINVSPLEVEEALESHPSVSQAIVVGIPDAQRGEIVAAVVELRDGATATAADLQQHVKDHSAAFKVPAVVLFRRQEELPKLASGKVARVVLRETVIAEAARVRE